jgi:hypothetical protein
VALLGGPDLPVASVLVSAAVGGAALILLQRALADWGLGLWRFVFVAAVAVNPLFFRECTGGTAGAAVVTLALLVVIGVTGWVEAQRVRYLVYVSLGAGLLTLAAPLLIPWLVLVLVLLVWGLLAGGRRSGMTRAALTLALLPVLYAVGLWFLMNWLIMGDSLYFARWLGGEVSRSALPGPAAASAGLRLAVLVPAAAAVGAMLVAALCGRRAAFFAGVLGWTPLVLAVLYRGTRAPWAADAAVLVLQPLAMLALAVTAAGPSRLGRTILRPAAGLAALVVAALLVHRAGGPQAFLRERPEADLQAGAGRRTWLPRIERYVLGRAPYPTVFVCGYGSFALLGDDAGDRFVHALDFNFNQARADYPGRTLFLLVRRPVGRGRTDSIHWKFDRLFDLGTRETLYDRDFGPWRLFEIVQAPPAGRAW